MESHNTENEPNGKLDRHLSKLYTTHACEISTPGKVAKDLNLAPSRVSELKAGSRRLTNEQAIKLQELYGLPSAMPGHWQEVEIMESTTLLKTLTDNTQTMQFSRLLALYSSDEYIEIILNSILINKMHAVDGYKLHPETHDDKQENERLTKVTKLAYFNTLLNSDYFNLWCKSALLLLKNENKNSDIDFQNFFTKDVLSAHKYENKIKWDMPTSGFCTLEMYIKSLAPDTGFTMIMGRDSSSFLDLIEHLLLINKVKGRIDDGPYQNTTEQDCKYIFGTKYNGTNISSPIVETVIVGECVWSLDECIQVGSPKKIKTILNWCSLLSRSYTLNSVMSEECVDWLKAKLYYTQQYQYYLQVQFDGSCSPCVNGRVLLIKINDRLRVFEEVSEIFTELGINDYFQEDMKKTVAIKGGYIPSAQYIN